MFNLETLSGKTAAELTKIMKGLGQNVPKGSTAQDLAYAILDFQAANKATAAEYYAKNFGTNAEETTAKAEPKKAAENQAGRKKLWKPPMKFLRKTPWKILKK